MKRFSYYFKFLLGWCFMLLGMISCDTASNTEDPDLNYFVKYYGGDGNQYGVDMLALNDGTFLLLGNYSESPFDTDVYLVKVNAEGDVIWENRFGKDVNNIWSAKDLEPTKDGNFIVLSDFQVTGPGPINMDLKLLKISPEGTLLDETDVFGTPANDFGRTITPLDNGGFIVSGTTEFTSTFNLVGATDLDLGDFFNYRFDQNLVQYPTNDWFPVFPGFGGKFDVAVKALEKPHEFYVFGYSNINLNNTNKEKRFGLFYFKRDSTGGVSNPYFPGNVFNDTKIQFVHPAPPQLGSGFLVIGTSQNNIGVSEIFIAKLRNTLTYNVDNDAILYNTIALGKNVRGVAAATSFTGSLGYLILGNEVRSTGATNIWLSKIDQSGLVLWSSTFGSEAEDDSGAAVAELPNGKIAILGTMGLANNQFKMALIKVNPKGQLLK